MALETESAAYRRFLPDLLARGLSGKFALVFGDELIGTFSTHSEALSAGYDRTLKEPFLVKQISAEEIPVFFSRNIFHASRKRHRR